MRSTVSRKRVGGVIFLFLAGLMIVMLRNPFLLAIGNFLVLRDRLHPADILHVISGPDFRADYAIQLVKDGYARQIFFTGSWCPDIQETHAERGELRAISQGISPAAIITDDTEIISTYEEALRLKALIERSPVSVRSVIIVSDPFHMRRARWAYRHILGKDIEIQMAPVPFEMTPFQRNWWKDWASRRMVLEEYAKYGYYLARYGLNWAPLSNWLATFDSE